MKFICPKCEAEIDVLPNADGQVQCPACAEMFVTPAGAALQKRRWKIKSVANFFTAISLLCILIAVICGIVTSAGGDVGAGFLLMGKVLALALIFFIVAQLVHIRANTER